MLRLNMCRVLGQTGRRIAAVTIGATKHDVRSFMHRLDTLMTLETSGAFCVCLYFGLIDPIAWRPFHGVGDRGCGGNRRRRSERLFRLLCGKASRHGRDKE